jgi:hypothetical protein
MSGKRATRKGEANAVSVPSEVVEFILKPRGLPHPQGNLDAYLKQCEKNLLDMLEEAMNPKMGVLPKRTVMVQCLSKPPVTGKADFSLPVLIKAESKEAACHLAAAFAHVTHYLIRGKSSHIRMREIGDCTRGNLVAFASAKPKAWLSTEVANVVHLCLPVSNKRPVPDFREVLEPLGKDFLHSSGGLWRFEMKRFVERASEKHWTAITQSVAEGLLSPDAQQSPCPKAKHYQRTRDVLDDILSDHEYLQRVSVLLASGQIILCLPQTHFFEDGRATTHHAESVVYDSGLTIVLGGDKPITREELEQCYWVGYVIASFLAGVYGLSNKLAHEVRRENTHTFAKALSHEIGNAGKIIYARLELTGLTAAIRNDIAARAYIASTAAQAIVAVGDSSKYEAVVKQTENICEHYRDFTDFRLTVEPYDASSLDGVQLSPTYTLLLNELLRNAYKHASRDAQDIRYAWMQLAVNGQSLVVKVRNQPRDTDKIANLREGLTNQASQKLARLRELATLLRTKPVLTTNNTEICIAVEIPIGLQT